MFFSLGVTGTTAGDTRAYSMGHRPVSYLQGRVRALLGGSGQRQRQPKVVGHLRRPREGQEIRLWTLRRGKLKRNNYNTSFHSTYSE